MSGPFQKVRRASTSAHDIAGSRSRAMRLASSSMPAVSPGSRVIAKCDAREFASHAQQPGEFGRHGESVPSAISRWDGKSIPQVALTSTEQLVIDSQNERVVASRSCSLGKLAREAAIPIDKDLHPAWRVTPRNRFKRAD